MEPLLYALNESNLTEEEKDTAFGFNAIDNNVSVPHKFFMNVLGIAKGKIKNQDYTSPHSEEIFRQILFRFADPNSLGDKIYRDTTMDFVKIKPTKSQFLTTIERILKDQYSDSNDVKTLSKYFQQSVEENPERTKYFELRGLSKEEAYCCALALSYYTGKDGTSTSHDINRRASGILRFGLKDQSLQDDFQIIYYFLMKALSCIPYFWGKCIRAAKLENNEVLRYEVGTVVSWIQFSSTNASEKPAVHFEGRNTYFYIYSLTGRNIQQFSNFSNSENEVLLPPYSTFLVCKKEVSREGKTYIYLRQIDIGMNKNAIMWVDDQIFNEEWENKMLMEKFTSDEGFQNNLHIIPKISTETAISFLESPLGKYFKQNKQFQFISDMSRPDEPNGKEAGAIFIKKIRDMGFTNKVLIYCYDEKVALDNLDKNGVKNLKNIFVTASQVRAIEYIKHNI